jgi:hypothetical protein
MRVSRFKFESNNDQVLYRQGAKVAKNNQDFPVKNPGPEISFALLAPWRFKDFSSGLSGWGGIKT